MYKYRHEIPEIFKQQFNVDMDQYLKNQKNRWACPNCDGTIKFYYYKCDKCGNKFTV